MMASLVVVGCEKDKPNDGLTIYFNIEKSGLVVNDEDNTPVENAQVIVSAYFPYNKITGGRSPVCDTFYTDAEGYYYPHFLQRVGNDYVIDYWLEVTTNDSAYIRWVEDDEVSYDRIGVWVDSVKRESYVLPIARLVKN
jgi:hypothetical protein